MVEQTFYYEDFCNDISNYLKAHTREYLSYSVDPFEALVVIDKDKLAITLSNFWLARENGDL